MRRLWYVGVVLMNGFPDAFFHTFTSIILAVWNRRKNVTTKLFTAISSFICLRFSFCEILFSILIMCILSSAWININKHCLCSSRKCKFSWKLPLIQSSPIICCNHFGQKFFRLLVCFPPKPWLWARYSNVINLCCCFCFLLFHDTISFHFLFLLVRCWLSHSG